LFYHPFSSPNLLFWVTPQLRHTPLTYWSGSYPFVFFVILILHSHHLPWITPDHPSSPTGTVRLSQPTVSLFKSFNVNGRVSFTQRARVVERGSPRITIISWIIPGPQHTGLCSLPLRISALFPRILFPSFWNTDLWITCAISSGSEYRNL